MTLIFPELVPLKYVYVGTNDLSAQKLVRVFVTAAPFIVADLYAQQAFDIVAQGSLPDVQISEVVDT